MTHYASYFASAFADSPGLDELNEFIRTHRVVHVEKRLVDSERGSGWLFLVEYMSGPSKENKRESFTPRVDYRMVLDGKDYELFNRLRTTRKELADASGNPVYAVFTNEQLAELARTRPKEVKDLLAINGVGEARIAQYGEHMIAVIAGTGSRGPVPVQ